MSSLSDAKSKPAPKSTIARKSPAFPHFTPQNYPLNSAKTHFYYPFLFTHQGATWTMPYLAGTIGVPFPAAAGRLAKTLSLTRRRFQTVTLAPGADRFAAELKAEAEIVKYFGEDQGPAQVAQWMSRVAESQKREHIGSSHIVFTEFGAMKQTINGVEIDRASRRRWLHDTAAAIASHGWGWTVFVLRDDPFGLYVHEGDRYPDPQILHALGLHAVDGERNAGPSSPATR